MIVRFYPDGPKGENKMATINTNGASLIQGRINVGKGKIYPGSKIKCNLEDVTDDFDLDDFDFPELDTEEDEEIYDLDEHDFAEPPANVNLGGGKYIPGNVNTKGKDFVGRNSS
jgi:hypothetical protein